MNRDDLKKNIVKRLYSEKNADKDKWAVFFLGSQLAIGKTKLYKHQGTARGRVIQTLLQNKWAWMNIEKGSACSWQDLKDDTTITVDTVKEVVKDLEDKGFLEIRQLGNRTPKFPYNIKEIDKEQADKFVKMLDAPDEEMCNLAIIVLEKMK